MRTEVGIVGAGPAGLLLAQLLDLAGISSVIIEARDRAYLEARIRAGVLEWGTVEMLREAGVNARMEREGLVHRGIDLAFRGRKHRIDFESLVGKTTMVYGQHEVVKDLIAARLERGGQIVFEAEDVGIENYEESSTTRPVIRYRKDGVEHRLECDFIAGCDGFHGICRPSLPESALKVYERTYPFGWLGILAEAEPTNDELIYANHERGFALYSMRSPTVTRLYLQCHPEEDLKEWPDERVWSELHRRLEDSDGWKLKEGPILQKSVTAMRSFVAGPMRHGRLFLAGDAAHIVPPTGAKGMNLAVADVRYLCRALERWYRHNDMAGLDGYSDKCLARVWKAQRFSWWMTQLMHRFEEATPFEHEVQQAELDFITSSRRGAAALAEQYVGLPFDD
ncbi:4-hydroxybenzoate 3-monooxygenase [Radicibacter daui]|uniref:4-hydroxybenzoate 3-monooxygenase n=1 Tax=Radicibacter daui TaxID=3064829 RepID=UPI004046D9B4